MIRPWWVQFAKLAGLGALLLAGIVALTSVLIVATVSGR